MRKTVSDSRIRIRTYTEDDIVPLFEAVRESIPELSRWMPWCDEHYHIDASRRWVCTRPESWEAATEYSFLIESLESGQFVGGCGINRIDAVHNTGNLGYWIRSSQTRKGHATAAALLMLQFGFDDIDLQRIEILMAMDNEPSRRVAEKIGATKEGLLRRRLRVHGASHDAWLYASIRSETRFSTERDRA